MADANEKHLTPPFLFTVTFQTRLPSLKFRFDVSGLDDKQARDIAEGLLGPAVKALMDSKKYSTGDLRPLFAEIVEVREDDPWDS